MNWISLRLARSPHQRSAHQHENLLGEITQVIMKTLPFLDSKSPGSKEFVHNALVEVETKLYWRGDSRLCVCHLFAFS